MTTNDQMRALCEAATTGPWTVHEEKPVDHSDWHDAGGYRIDTPDTEQMAYVWNRNKRFPVDAPQSEGPEFGTVNGLADAAFIAASREWVPQALTQLSEQAARVKELEKALRFYAKHAPKDSLCSDCGCPTHFKAKEALKGAGK